MRKRLLFLSNLYPNPAFPNQASFNCQQVQALAEWFDVSVLSPIPFVNRAAVKAAQKDGHERSLAFFPTYWYTPGILRPLHGKMMLASVAASAEKLHRRTPFDMVMGSWLYPDGWAAGKLAKKWDVPFYLKVHGTDVNRLTAKGALTKASLSGIQGSRGIFCVSKALRTRLVDLGVAEEKCHVVYNGINSEIFFSRDKSACRQTLGLSFRETIILYVGNLLKSKGLEELAVAFTFMARENPNLRLVVIGSGPYAGSFQEKIRKEGMTEKVFFAGSIKHQEIAVWMNAADALCLPSYMEGVPNVVLEALACNTPVVATSVGGVPELAGADDRITLARPRDSVSLQTAIEKALQGGLPGEKRLSIQPWQNNASALASIMLGGVC